MSVGFDHMDLHELKARNIKVYQNTNTLQIDQLINFIQNYIVNVSSVLPGRIHSERTDRCSCRYDSCPVAGNFQKTIWSLGPIEKVNNT